MMAVPTILDLQGQSSSLALPAAATPGAGLLVSALGHAAAVSVLLTWLPIPLPGRRAIAVAAAVDIRRKLDFQVTMLPLLPPTGDGSAISDLERLPEQVMRSATNLNAEGGRPDSNHPKPDFAGPQEIVSNVPEATNNVQTIRRPDLVAPPTLPNPIHLESLVKLSAPPAPVQRAPELEQHVLPSSQELPEERSLVVAADRVMPRVAGSDTEDNVPEAVVVVDAVSVPPERVPVIPDAELPGRFVVAPWMDGRAAKGGSADGTDKVAAPVEKNAQNLSSGASNNGSGTGLEVRGGSAAAARSGSESGVGTRPAGISILGGTSGPGERSVAARNIPRGTYALTIISGGSSGGATRDLGVFSRNETVYTVGIPMSDAGGGSDWSMAYALMDAAAASNGLPTPPFALKKIAATGPNTDRFANSGPVLVTGVIDENGKLQALRAIRTSDVRAQSAVDALEQWEFRPAQLDGKPVASKILIGVDVSPR
jgi:hypothetical protein